MGAFTDKEIADSEAAAREFELGIQRMTLQQKADETARALNAYLSGELRGKKDKLLLARRSLARMKEKCAKQATDLARMKSYFAMIDHARQEIAMKRTPAMFAALHADQGEISRWLDLEYACGEARRLFID